MKAKRKTIKAHYITHHGKRKLVKAYERKCANQFTD
jgi:hypothetical protein